MSSDFDDFMKENEDPTPEPDIFELEVSEDKSKQRNLVDQIKEAIHFEGKDTDWEILQITCEEFLEICNREAASLKKQIEEIKEMKRVKVERSVSAELTELDKTAIDKALKKDIN